MRPIETPPLTAEEFWEWGADQDWSDCYHELHAGKVVTFSLNGERHGFVCASVAWVLSLYVTQQRAGMVMTNQTALLTQRNPDTLLGPDIMFFRHGKTLEELGNSFCDDIPTLVVEVLDPKDGEGAMPWRVAQYRQRGCH